MPLDLFVIRHAKSSWEDFSLPDHDRPLNKRGFRDAPRMAEMLKSIFPHIDLFISSTAKRALTTANFFSTEFNKEIIDTKNLYHANAEVYFDELMGLDTSISSVALFGHNPGITHLANLVSEVYIDNIPTCGICHLKSNVNSWDDVNVSNTKLHTLYFPKMFSWAKSH